VGDILVANKQWGREYSRARHNALYMTLNVCQRVNYLLSHVSQNILTMLPTITQSAAPSLLAFARKINRKHTVNTMRIVKLRHTARISRY
jgi:hypothetical protein